MTEFKLVIKKKQRLACLVFATAGSVTCASLMALVISRISFLPKVLNSVYRIRACAAANVLFLEVALQSLLSIVTVNDKVFLLHIYQILNKTM